MADRVGHRLVECVRQTQAEQGTPTGPPAQNALCAVVDEDAGTRRVFGAKTPNQLWLTDITEHETAKGKLYLCAIKDVFSS